MLAPRLVGVSVVATLMTIVPISAQACGVFGTKKCSLIRGWVGKTMAPVQRTVFTPVLQTAVVVGATALAVGYAGSQAAPVGATLGNGVNDLFAGKGGEKREMPPQEQVAMGSKCSNEVIGDFPLGNPAPIGADCSVKLQNGKDVLGKVI